MWQSWCYYRVKVCAVQQQTHPFPALCSAQISLKYGMVIMPHNHEREHCCCHQRDGFNRHTLPGIRHTVN